MRKITEKLQKFEKELNESVLERETLIHHMILSLGAKEHIMLVGEPGIGKSYMANQFSKGFPYTGSDNSKPYFQIQLHNGIETAQIFGPPDIEEYKKGKLINKWQNYLPNARFALIDEITRANKMAKNCILEVINERTFTQDGVTIPAKLDFLIATSNFKFNSAEFQALADRFVSWFELKGLSRESRRKLICKTINKQAITTSFSEKEVKEFQKAVSEMPVTEEVYNTIANIRDELKFQHGIEISDRKEESLTKLVCAEAVIKGRPEPIVEDCWVTIPCFWTDPAHKEIVTEVVEKHAANQKQILERLGYEALEKLGDAKREPDALQDAKIVLDEILQTVDNIKPQPEYKDIWEKTKTNVSAYRTSIAELILMKNQRIGS